MTMPEPASAPESRVQAELRACFTRLVERGHEWLLERSKTLADTWGEQTVTVEEPPEWVINATNLFVQPYVRWLDGMEEDSPTLEDFGKLVGGLKIGSDNGGNHAPLLAWCGRFGSVEQVKTMLEPVREAMVLLSDAVKEILHKVEEFPAHEAEPFYRGYETALRHNLVDERGKAIIKNDAIPLYMFLVMFWPVVQQQRGVNQLHSLMRKFFTIDVLGDVDRLKGICKKIKLHLGKRGRPKKKNRVGPESSHP